MRAGLRQNIKCETVSPYHAVNGTVYHICRNCIKGKNIEPQNKREGMGHKKLCVDCQKLTMNLS